MNLNFRWLSFASFICVLCKRQTSHSCKGRRVFLNLKGTCVAQRHFSNSWKWDQGGGGWNCAVLSFSWENYQVERKMRARWQNLGEAPLLYSSGSYVNSIPWENFPNFWLLVFPLRSKTNRKRKKSTLGLSVPNELWLEAMPSASIKQSSDDFLCRTAHYF